MSAGSVRLASILLATCRVLDYNNIRILFVLVSYGILGWLVGCSGFV
jgi:hypothetical protein